MTYTYAVLDVPSSVYADVRQRLLDAGYQHAFHRDGASEVIDMHGIALRQAAVEQSCGSFCPDGGVPGYVMSPCEKPLGHAGACVWTLSKEQL